MASRPERGIHVQHRRQFFVLDGDLFQRFLRGQFVFGNHGGHGLAHEAHFADGEQRMILHRVAVIRMEARQGRFP